MDGTNLPSGPREYDAHAGRKPVEHAERQIGQSGHTEDCGLCDATRIPWNQNGGNGYRVLYGAGKQSRFKSVTPIKVAEHIAGNYQ